MREDVFSKDEEKGNWKKWFYNPERTWGEFLKEKFGTPLRPSLLSVFLGVILAAFSTQFVVKPRLEEYFDIDRQTAIANVGDAVKRKDPEAILKALKGSSFSSPGYTFDSPGFTLFSPIVIKSVFFNDTLSLEEKKASIDALLAKGLVINDYKGKCSSLSELIARIPDNISKSELSDFDKDNIKMLEFLIKKGALPDDFAFKYAMRSGNTEVLDVVFSKGARPKSGFLTEYMHTLLTDKKIEAAIQHVIDKGYLDINQIYGDLRPVHSAALKRDEKRIQKLLDQGLDPTTKNEQGKTVLEVLRNGYFEEVYKDTQMHLRRKSAVISPKTDEYDVFSKPSKEKLEIDESYGKIQAMLEMAIEKWGKEHPKTDAPKDLKGARSEAITTPTKDTTIRQ